METLHHVAAALAVAWHYFCAHIAGPLAATLLPTILTGLMVRPGADSSKLVKVVKLLIRGCSWAVHYDEPGSVKLPFIDLLILLWKGAVELYRVFRPAAPALLFVFVATQAGCLLKGMPKTATFAQKVSADEAALAKIGLDVWTKCGDKLKAFPQTFSTGLAIAGSYADPLADLANAAALYHEGKLDVEALQCVYDTVRAGLKAISPSQAAKLSERADRIMVQLRISAPDESQCIPWSTTAPVCAQEVSYYPATQPEVE